MERLTLMVHDLTAVPTNFDLQQLREVNTHARLLLDREWKRLK